MPDPVSGCRDHLEVDLEPMTTSNTTQRGGRTPKEARGPGVPGVARTGPAETPGTWGLHVSVSESVRMSGCADLTAS